MNNTLRHIEFLTTRLECVVVPGFGALLSRYEGAYFDALTNELKAPARRLVFNNSICEDDGLIANSIARANKISYEKASKIMADELHAMKLRFDADGELDLGRVGRITKQEDGGIKFEASHKFSNSSAYSWLRAVKPVDVSEHARVAGEDLDDEVAGRTSRLASVMTYVRAACVLAIFVCVGLAVSTPVNVDNAEYASLAPAIKMGRSIDKATSFTMIIDKHLNDSDLVDTARRFAWQRVRRNAAQTYNAYHAPEVRDANPYAETEKQEANSQVSKPRFIDTDSYFVIVASLTSQRDADKFIDQQRARNNDLPLGVIVNDGRYRVYAATGSTLAEAQRGVNEMSRRFDGAWICKK